MRESDDKGRQKRFDGETKGDTRNKGYSDPFVSVHSLKDTGRERFSGLGQRWTQDGGEPVVNKRETETWVSELGVGWVRRPNRLNRCFYYLSRETKSSFWENELRTPTDSQPS